MSSSRVVLAALLLVALPALADEPGTGSFRYADPSSGEPRRFPLEHTWVMARVSGTVADVTVTQRFANPLTAPLLLAPT